MHDYYEIAVPLVGVPLIALCVSLSRLTAIAPEMHKQRFRWRLAAWITGSLTVGSVILAVLIFYALKSLAT